MKGFWLPRIFQKSPILSLQSSKFSKTFDQPNFYQPKYFFRPANVNVNVFFVIQNTSVRVKKNNNFF